MDEQTAQHSDQSEHVDSVTVPQPDNAAAPDSTTDSTQTSTPTPAPTPTPTSTSTDSDVPTPSGETSSEPVPADITSEQISQLKNEAIEFAKSYAKTGTSTRKEPSPNLANDQGPYYWWEKQATYESNTWSISYWEYDNQNWQLQATKVELKPDGHSLMTAYSMRKDTDTSFPGFQVYKEQSEGRYHQASIEEIMYLHRVLENLKSSDA
jgi:hypothetical protein